MKKLMLAVAAVAAVSVPLSAYAAPPKTPKSHGASAKAHEETTSGAISAISASELKLATGQVFKFAPSGAGPGSFKAGDKVNVKWTHKDGDMVVAHIEAAK